MKGKTPLERGVLVRAARFEIKPTPEQEAILWQISENLRQVWNSALEARQAWLQAYLAWLSGTEQAIRELPFSQLVEVFQPGEEGAVCLEEPTDRKAAQIRVGALKAAKKAYYAQHRAPTLFDQINELTAQRKDPDFGAVPRNWQEETLDRVNGSWESWRKLREKGDLDARAPRSRHEGQFQVIHGRSGFSYKNGKVTLNCKGDVSLLFTVPEYSVGVLEAAQQADLERFKIKKFVLSREPHDRSKPGRYWLSLIYEVARPLVQPDVPAKTVYLALGASSIGVVSGQREMVLDLWRPDAYWQPKIEEIKQRMKGRTKGSHGWKKLYDAKRTMEVTMARQRRQHFHEVAHQLLKLGCHFVVTEYDVRSKVGALADTDKPERGGVLGRNWSSQNTGSLAEFVLILTHKAEEVGGSVRKHRLVMTRRVEGHGHDNKLQLAHALRDQVGR